MLFTAIAEISLMIVGAIIYPIYIIFSAYCLKRLYKLDLGEIILKTFLFIIVLTIFIVVSSIVFFGSFYLIDSEGLKEFVIGMAPKK